MNTISLTFARFEDILEYVNKIVIFELCYEKKESELTDKK